MTNQLAPKSYYYKLFRVKTGDGRVSTVSLDPALSRVACQALGGLTEVGKLVRAAALRYQPEMSKNMSSYVSVELHSAIAGVPTSQAASVRAPAALKSAQSSATITSTMPNALYLEDINVGDQFTSESLTVDEAEIKEFAGRFDPQAFHLDSEAAKGTLFKGLAASGWHTAAMSMRLIVGSVPIHNGVVGAGVELAWPTPTRPGDTLHVESTILAITPSKSKPGQAIVTCQSDTLNQSGACVQRLTSKLLVFARQAPGTSS